MPSELEIKNEKDKNKMKFFGFCIENCTNGVDEKNLQMIDCSFKNGKISFFNKLYLK